MHEWAGEIALNLFKNNRRTARDILKNERIGGILEIMIIPTVTMTYSPQTSQSKLETMYERGPNQKAQGSFGPMILNATSK